MRKAAAKSKTTTSAQGELEQLIDTSAQASARGELLGQMIDMGWQLLLAVLGPILLGVWADGQMDSAPALSLVGFTLAIALSSYLIYREYKIIQQNSKSSTNSPKNTKHTKGNA